jgi:type VI secretion system protein ImpK
MVPMTQSNDTLTNFNETQGSYKNFKSNAITRAKVNLNDNFYEGSTNSFIVLSADIFREINILQNSYDIGSLSEVRGILIEDIEYFTNAALKLGLENSQVMLARYLLCTFADEMINTTYWGKENNWANSSLLGHFYNETYGGDKFFQILDQLLRAPAKYLDLLELIYICLSLGFEGKYKIKNRGQQELDAIQDSLYRQMKTMQIRESKKFYTTQKSSSKNNHLMHKTSYQILGISIAIMLSLVYVILTFSLVNKEDSTLSFLKTQYNNYVNEKKPVVSHSTTGPTNIPTETIVIKDLNE